MPSSLEMSYKDPDLGHHHRHLNDEQSPGNLCCVCNRGRDCLPPFLGLQIYEKASELGGGDWKAQQVEKQVRALKGGVHAVLYSE